MVSVDYARLSLVANKDALLRKDLICHPMTDMERVQRGLLQKLVKINEDGAYSQVPMFLDLNWDLVYIASWKVGAANGMIPLTGRSVLSDEDVLPVSRKCLKQQMKATCILLEKSPPTMMVLKIGLCIPSDAVFKS